jgi:hypothetical protein
VFELRGACIREPAWDGFGEPFYHSGTADDPEHTEAAERVQGSQPLLFL